VTKTNAGNFFEDFYVGQVIRHATPRTVTSGDVALYTALYGSRFAVQSSDAFAKALGYAHAPVDDLLTFHVVFGKTVPDISLNAVANLGYAGGRFLAPVYPGDTLVGRLRGDRQEGKFQRQDRRRLCALDRLYGGRHRGARLCPLGDGQQARSGKPRAGRGCSGPALRASMRQALGNAVPMLDTAYWDNDLAGSKFRFGDYEVGEKIDHVDGMTVEESEHQLATRLYQNTAKVHFNQHTEGQGRFGRRLIYGGHVISLARGALLQRPRQRLPCRRHQRRPPRGPALCRRHGLCLVGSAGQVRNRGPHRRRRPAPAPGRHQEPPLRRLPAENGDGKYADGVILDFDYWALMPK
jgi:2-methylfumaryl-CoA hydratase